MNLNIEKCDEFKNYVECLVEKYNTPGGLAIEKVLNDLFPYAKSISEQYIRERHLEGHSTGVSSRETDYTMLMMSIVPICWAIRMRRRKSSEGQCHEHKTLCNEARIFHSKLYDEWIAIVEEALQALRSDRPATIT